MLESLAEWDVGTVLAEPTGRVKTTCQSWLSSPNMASKACGSHRVRVEPVLRGTVLLKGLEENEITLNQI